MRIGIVHGWLLDGSGSNIYVRALARAIADRGHAVHVICQEPHPDRVDDVDAAYSYRQQAGEHPLVELQVAEPIFDRRADRSSDEGSVIVHVPCIDHDVMPVFNADTAYEGFEEVKTFHDMVADGDEARLKRYLAQWTAGLAAVCYHQRLELLHANHVYPMPEISRRVKDLLGTPFLVYPHGSAIEYTIKQSEALAADAARAIDEADALIVGNQIVTDRIYKLYPDRMQAWKRKHQIVSVGVDPSIFEPVEIGERAASVAKLQQAELPEGGRTIAQRDALLQEACGCDDDAQLVQIVQRAREVYEHKVPDGDLKQRLSEVDWQGGRFLVFVGKLIVGKGLHDFVVALPAILDKHPNTTLLVVGEGPFREPLELLLAAMTRGDRALFERIVRLGWGLDTFDPRPLEKIETYLEQTDLDALVQLGQRTKPLDHVLFTGYLKHKWLKFLFPCADLAVFPSEIAEAYPLVLMESISAAVLPLASYFEGLGDGLDTIGNALDPELAPLMRLEMAAEQRIPSMIDHVIALLQREPTWRARCRELAVEQYAWPAVAAKMEAVYEGLK